MRDRLMFLISVMTLVTAQPALSNSTTSPAILFDFGSGFDVGAVATTDAKAQVTPGGTLRIELGHQAP
ncbi:MAG: hypothetical protein KBI32_12735, partial [Phycisphaerae bacterium]|nr:hypothetical protein [Phycisphaerae bacterium]